MIKKQQLHLFKQKRVLRKGTERLYRADWQDLYAGPAAFCFFLFNVFLKGFKSQADMTDRYLEILRDSGHAVNYIPSGRQLPRTPPLMDVTRHLDFCNIDPSEDCEKPPHNMEVNAEIVHYFTPLYQTAYLL